MPRPRSPGPLSSTNAFVPPFAASSSNAAAPIPLSGPTPSSQFAIPKSVFYYGNSDPRHPDAPFQEAEDWDEHLLQHQPQHRGPDRDRAGSAAAVVRDLPKSAFSARKSSLAPAPYLQAATGNPSHKAAPPLFRDPFDAPARIPNAGFTHEVIASQPSAPATATELTTTATTSGRRPAAAQTRHSRSSSFGEGARNLNRWSLSTTSSHASPSRASPSTRRMSVDSVALTNQAANSTPPRYSSPRRLQKRPSTGSSPRPATSGSSRPRHEAPASIPPLASLPPIVSLSSLEKDLRLGPSSRERSQEALPDHLPRPSGADGVASTADSSSIWASDTLLFASQRLAQQPSAAAENSSTTSTMPHQHGEARGHTRRRSDSAKGSGDSSRARNRSKQPSQKAMLSKALQKANTAVQLDNAQNFEGAREAYSEACELLQQVLSRTNGDDDKRKLEAIRITYTSRIDELDGLLPSRSYADGKALPRRPDSGEPPDEIGVALSDDEEDEFIGTATALAAPRYRSPLPGARPGLASPPHIIPNASFGSSNSFTGQPTLQSAFSRSPNNGHSIAHAGLQVPVESQYIPPPLSPRRPAYPASPPSPEVSYRQDFSSAASRLTPESNSRKGHRRGNSHESVSWLAPIDELGGGSPASSMHSRTSSLNVRRKHIRAASGDTEAEFDAALDDAIEAAYNEGYGAEESIPSGLHNEMRIDEEEEEEEDVIAKALWKVQLAKERVRESEREALELANERERRLRQQLEEEDYEETEAFYDGNDSDEEERMLDEMTAGYTIEDFSLGLQPRPVAPRAPRESDSSELTSRTWHSSMGSNPTTVATALSTVSENTIVPGAPKEPAPLPPPTQSLPHVPQRPGSSAGNVNKETVRSRRLSGQNAKQLKIETSVPPQPPLPGQPATAPQNPPFAQEKILGPLAQGRQALSAGPRAPSSFGNVPGHSPIPTMSPPDVPPPTPPMPQGFMDSFDSRSGSPAGSRPPTLKKNFSSSSLKSMRNRNMSLSQLDETSDMSSGTPLTSHFNGSHTKLPAMPTLPTPIVTAFRDKASAGGAGGMHLFDSDFHSPESPGSPNPLLLDAPVPLEPCPNDFLLRPFWLMRCLYQTLAHPRGGYVSNKLFVPTDVWKVKGVKLKNVEDKIAQCDLLTAALQKLARVDTCDADDVLDEMQALEGVFEQVQAALTRRLGNEVGVHGSNAMFKDATTVDTGGGGDSAPTSSSARSGSISAGSKSSSFSWRRLRSKNSSAGINREYRKGSVTEGSDGGGGGGSGGGLTLLSLPMTSQPTSKPSKRELNSVQFTGPNSNYMSSLARLFDAAQAIDQIARQVEDPGLRHADKTQVGLELCTRHAAEFFGFFICRFVLADLTMLLDKFIKRGSEWVLV